MKNMIIICTEKLSFFDRHNVREFLYDTNYNEGYHIKEEILNTIKNDYEQNLGSNEKSLWLINRNENFTFENIDETDFYKDIDLLRKSGKIISYGKLGSINLVILQEISTETRNIKLTKEIYNLFNLDNDTFITRVNSYREIVDCVLPDLKLNNKYVHANDINKMSIGTYDFEMIPNEFLLIPGNHRQEWIDEFKNNFKLYSSDGEEITNTITVKKGINHYYLVCNNAYTLRNSSLTGSYKIGNGVITILGV